MRRRDNSTSSGPQGARSNFYWLAVPWQMEQARLGQSLSQRPHEPVGVPLPCLGHRRRRFETGSQEPRANWDELPCRATREHETPGGCILSNGVETPSSAPQVFEELLEILVHTFQSDLLFRIPVVHVSMNCIVPVIMYAGGQECTLWME